MPRPTFLQEDTVKRADRLALSNKIDADLFAFSFPDQMERDIQSLQAPEPDPLPIVVTPRPQIRPLTPREPEPSQPMSMPRQPSPMTMPTTPVDSRASTTPSAPGVAAMAPAASSGQPSAMPTGRTEPHLAMVARVAREEGVPFDALAALADVERSADDSVSPSGARGRWQVVPGQGFDLPGEDPSNPEVSARQGARALREKFRMTGSWDEAGRAYFGYGTDAGGMDTGTYGRRYDEARRRYQGQRQGPQPTTPPPAEETPQAQAQAFSAGSYTPNQIDAATSEGLDYETALAVCGPAAAIAFARKNGRNPTMAEAVRLAREVGWTADAGMAGPASQQRLLERMGIASRLVDGAPDWRAIAADVQRGNPVTISTPGHYFVAERYDPDSGSFDFGESARVLKVSGGRRWFRPEELPGLGMGSPRASLFIDSPESPSPSVVAGRVSLTAGDSRPPAGAQAIAGGSSPSAPGGGSPDMMRMSLGGTVDPAMGDAPVDPASIGAPEDPYAWPTYMPPDDRNPNVGYWPEGDEGRIKPYRRPDRTFDREGVERTDEHWMDPLVPSGRMDGLGVPDSPHDSEITPGSLMYRGPLQPAPGDTFSVSNDDISRQMTPNDAISDPTLTDPVYTQPPIPQTTATYREVEQSPDPLGPEMPQPTAISAIEAARAEPEELAPRIAAPRTTPEMLMPGAIDPAEQARRAREALTAPARQVYEEAVAPVNQRHDAISAANDEKMSEFARRAAVPLETVNRGIALVNAVLMATPEAAADTLNEVLTAVGLDRDTIGVTEPLTGQRIGIADIADVGPLTNIGVGRAGARAATTAAGRATAGLVPNALAMAEPIENATGAAVRAAGRAIGSGARALGEAASDAGTRVAEGFREGRRVARELNAQPQSGSVYAPGVFGISGVTPDTPGVQGMRPRVVPPEVADTLDFPVRIPEDPRAIRAIEAVGGTVDPERGVTMNVIRMSDPEAAGGVATRGGMFYTAGPPGSPSPYARSGTVGPGGVGGQQRIEGMTRFRSPLFISHAPGEAAGFDDAMRQLGAIEHPNVAAARRAVEEADRVNDAVYYQRDDMMQRWYDANPRWTEEQADAFRASPEYARLTDELFRTSDASQRARTALRAAEEAHPSVNAEDVERGIREAKRAGPAGSPERAQALKDLVTRYGGDPNLIDDLMALRGADASESTWAIKENILAAHARRQGYDGVITVQPAAVPESEINAHPAVKQASDAYDRAVYDLSVANAAYGRAQYAYGEARTAAMKVHGLETPDTLPELQPSVREIERTKADVIAAQKAKGYALQALSDVSDKVRAELARGKITELVDVREGRNPTPADQTEAWNAAHERVLDRGEELDEAARLLDQHENLGDDAAWNHYRRLWENARRAFDAAVDEREALRGTPGYTLRSDIPRRPDTGSTTAQATAGVASRAGSDTLAQVNADIGSALGSSTFGAATGAALPAETDEERRQNALTGAGIGLVAGPAASRLIRSRGGALATPGISPRPSPSISPLGQRVMETYRAVTPQRVEASTTRSIQIASDAIAGKIPRRGGLSTPPAEIVRATHDAIVRNLADTKVVATGLRQGAIEAFLRGEGLTSKVETGDLDTINRITQQQVNVAGGRAKVVDGKKQTVPYTLEDAADFAQRESLQMRMATGGTRFPDPETGAIDEAAPRVNYAYVSEGQPLVGPNRPNLWLVWNDDTPRITSAHHPYGLGSPGQDIHAGMPPGLKAAIWAEDAVAGGRAAPGILEGGNLVEAARGVPGTSPVVTGWERKGIAVGRGRKIADTNWLVGPDGEDAMRANGLILSMPQKVQQQIARGELSDPEQIAAVLMRGGPPQWKSGWAAALSAQRSESLILDPALENVKAIYLTATPKNLETRLPNTGGTGRARDNLTELQVAQRMRQEILEKTGRDVPILFTDISKPGQPRSMAAAEVLEGQPLALAPGRSRIVDQYTQAIDPATKQPYVDIGGRPGVSASASLLGDVANSAGGGVFGAATGAALPAETDEERRRNALVGAGVGMVAGPAAGRVLPRTGGALATPGVSPGAGQPNPVTQIAQQIAAQPMTGPHTNQQHMVRNIARGIQRAQKQGAVTTQAPPIPGLPTPPPNAPVSWWDIAQSWRYGVGLFGNVSTALMQTMGGLAEVGIGAPTEVIRQAIVRGHPEHVPLIAWEALKSPAAGLKSAGETIAGRVPQTIMSGSDYRPPTSERMQPGAGRNLVFAAETPGRIATQAPDALWYEVFYRTGLAQAAAEEAQKTVSRWNPLASVQMQRQLIQNPTPEVMAKAHQLAQDSTYKGDLGAVLGSLETAIRGGPQASETRKAIGSILMPVYHTIARIHEGALEFTPGIGALPLNRAGLAAKGRSADQKIAQQVMAVGLFGSMMGYAASGGIRGPGPDDPEKRKMMMDDGYIPNTTNVGGYWVPNQYFGRAGPILNAIGSLNDAVLYHDPKKGKFSEQSLQRQTEVLLKNLGRSFRDYPFVEAVATLTEIAEDPVGTLGRFAGETASTYSPALYRTYATATDPNVRRPDRDPDKPFLQNVTDTFQQRSGINRQSLPVAQDVLGREVENPRQGAAALFPRLGSDKADPIIAAFLDPKVGVDIGAPPKSFTEQGVKIEMTPEQQRAYQRYMGEHIIRGFNRANNASDRRRADMLKDLYEDARAKAQAQVRADIGRSEIRQRVKTGAGR